jgi:uncharacterized protein (DUF433 family)
MLGEEKAADCLKGKDMKTIEIDPKVCNGKPVIAGTRIPVTVILDHFADGCTAADIQRKFPELTADLISDALRYCHAMIDHCEVEVVTA